MADWAAAQRKHLPQQGHVFLTVHRVTEDVTFQRRFQLLRPKKNSVTGPQTDLKTNIHIHTHKYIIYKIAHIYITGIIFKLNVYF